ncbi:MAG: PAS domain S-box protein [Pseudomonadota bacterium]
MKYKFRFFISLFLLGICAYLFYAVYDSVRKEMIRDLNIRQTAHAKQAAKGIENFFKHYLNMLNCLSQIDSIIRMDDQGRDLMQIFYNNNINEVKGVTRVDANGRIIHTYPFDSRAIGVDISYQDHVAEIMKTQKPVVSDVFEAVQGFRCIAFHVPVFKEETYDGSIVVLFPFDHISKNFLEDIRIGQDGYAWLISPKGVELYCPIPGHIGKTIYETSGQFPGVISMAEEMRKGRHGTTTYLYDRIRGDIKGTLKKQAVYLPISIINTFWSIVVATPEDEALSMMKDFKNKWMLIIGVMTFGWFLLSYFLLRAWGVIREERKRKTAEEALKQSEEKYRELVENVNSIIFRRDAAGVITFINEFAQKFFEYDEKEILGRNVVGTIVPEIESTGRDLKWIIADIGRNPDLYINNINENMRRNGDRVWIAWTNKPVYDENHQIKEILCIGNDFTERIQAEKEVADWKHRFESVAAASGQIVYDYDVVKGKDTWSGSIEQVLGYQPFEMGGGSSEWENLIDPRDREAVLRLLDISWKNGTPFLAEYGFRHKDGYYVRILDRGFVLPDAAGRFERMIGMMQDITARKQSEEERQRLEERLARAEKMEALGTLAGGVAHDLNNVLGVLVGYSELLIEKIPESSPLKKYAENILKSGVRGAAIIQDLLTLARRGVAVSEVVNLNRIAADYFKTPEFENLKSCHAQVTFTIDLENDLLNIKGSPVHLGKMLMNLVSNAAEAISERGSVTIRTENTYLDSPIQGYDEMLEGDYVVLTVSDTGGGISAKDIGKIFEPFYTKKVMGKSGTGLGLAVVWGTVKDHDGYIDVKSDAQKETVFSLYFPVTRDEVAEERKSLSPEAFMGRGESILVVDDVKEQRELAMIMLTRLGYCVTTLSGGEAAIEYLKTNRIDLIVLDMIMDPGMDGLETYQRIIETHPNQKAIIVSGYSETDRVKKAQELGAGAYVRKPYVMEKIGLAIRKQLDRSVA